MAKVQVFDTDRTKLDARKFHSWGIKFIAILKESTNY